MADVLNDATGPKVPTPLLAGPCPDNAPAIVTRACAVAANGSGAAV
jgi:hypothetical protein